MRQLIYSHWLTVCVKTKLSWDSFLMCFQDSIVKFVFIMFILFTLYLKLTTRFINLNLLFKFWSLDIGCISVFKLGYLFWKEYDELTSSPFVFWFTRLSMNFRQAIGIYLAFFFICFFFLRPPKSIYINLQ